MRYINSLLISLLITFSACNGDNTDTPSSSDEDTNQLLIDTIIPTDTVITPAVDTLVVDSAGYVNEEEVLTTKIEKEYGIQWDFCDCVIKNDSINKAVETTPDEGFDALLARMDTIDMHCKEMLTTPNTTPDERAKHERKVNKCLRNR